MSEDKRFKISEFVSLKGDAIGYTILDRGERMDIFEVVDILNKQRTIIDNKEEHIQELEDLLTQVSKNNTELRRENEDLKFALRAEQALNSVHNSSQPFRI